MKTAKFNSRAEKQELNEKENYILKPANDGNGYFHRIIFSLYTDETKKSNFELYFKLLALSPLKILWEQDAG